MTRFTSFVVFSALLAGAAAAAGGQACYGAPDGQSLAYEYAKMSVGTSQGVAGALAGSHAALGVGFAARTVGEISGQQGSMRLSLGLPMGNLSLCPGIGLIYQHDRWDVRDDVSLTAHNASARAGAGLGYEQRIASSFSISPFVVAQYEFALSVYDIDTPPNSRTTTKVTGDTLSRVQIEYGIIGRYQFLYGGIAAHRTSESKSSRPDMARWIIGVAFSPMRQRRAK